MESPTYPLWKSCGYPVEKSGEPVEISPGWLRQQCREGKAPPFPFVTHSRWGSDWRVFHRISTANQELSTTYPQDIHKVVLQPFPQANCQGYQEITVGIKELSTGFSTAWLHGHARMADNREDT